MRIGGMTKHTSYKMSAIEKAKAKIASLSSSEPSQLGELKNENLKLRSEHIAHLGSLALRLTKISQLADNPQDLDVLTSEQLITHAYVLDERMSAIKKLAEVKGDIDSAISAASHVIDANSVYNDTYLDELNNESSNVAMSSLQDDISDMRDVSGTAMKTLKESFFENATTVSGLSHQTLSDLLAIDGLSAVGEVPAFTLINKKPLTPLSNAHLEFIFLGSWKHLEYKLVNIKEIQSLESAHNLIPLLKENRLLGKPESRTFRNQAPGRHIRHFTIHAFSGDDVTLIHLLDAKMRTFDFLQVLYDKHLFHIRDAEALRTKTHNTHKDHLYGEISSDHFMKFGHYKSAGFMFHSYPGRAQVQRTIADCVAFHVLHKQ